MNKVFAINSDSIVEWIWENRRGDVFIGYSKEAIKAEIETAYLNNTLEVSRDDEGNINGVLICEPRLHVKQFLTTKHSIFYKLAYLMNLKFAGVKWQAHRKGNQNKLKTYSNGDRLLDIIKAQLKLQKGT